jgi:hypothetical protein
MANNTNLARNRMLSSDRAERSVKRAHPVLVENQSGDRDPREATAKAIERSGGTAEEVSASAEFERKRRRPHRDEANVDIYTLYAREMGSVNLLTPEEEVSLAREMEVSRKGLKRLFKQYTLKWARAEHV